MTPEHIHIPAYTISNENQRWATSVLPGVNRVLTVAGSGDQALFYTLSGVKYIDTFDITPNARVIQDIKYAAIKHMKTPAEYQELLMSLYCVRDTMSIPGMPELRPLLTAQSCETLDFAQLHSVHIFRTELNAEKYSFNIPTDREYAQLKSRLKSPFNFIECDLMELSGKITGKYDLINLSNIFDSSYDTQNQAKILTDLGKHLNTNGRIVYLPQLARYKYDRVRLGISQKSELVYNGKLEYDGNTMLIFQRQHIR